MINVLYFARLKEQLNIASEELEASSLSTLADIIRQLTERGGVWEETFGSGQTVMMAVNQEMSDAAASVKDGDEVAFFPPVTGG
ncbi:molybdopterin converting factor subunit 1 [Candidatus Vondammii sp. HM_W22]|uniref:molybdopterin converting factor subunit 1 n=1 Tax=Candidatus Vondammii sp. HM_W22 TaxID=2687299 RepID=UPI001F1423A9|nr:molybdopterin converting factor subunit 1 [Candidatus Vondammii sp. HM_W22]